MRTANRDSVFILPQSLERQQLNRTSVLTGIYVKLPMQIILIANCQSDGTQIFRHEKRTSASYNAAVTLCLEK